ncbi:XRE family transcriptional regulator [Pseudohaliea sp.]|uniref:helix-turn-helix domain-containing protein n=1 Tax=Pseudohaliea sp. TaxID=2740289 RepID=UPI0032EEB15F
MTSSQRPGDEIVVAVKDLATMPEGARAPGHSEGDLVGQEIRRLRKAKKMTLAEMSEATGISIGYLSQIERDISSPTIKVLFEISHALDVNVAWFFHQGDGHAKDSSRFVVRSGNRLELNFRTGVTDFLLNTRSISQLEVLWCTFEPGAGSGDLPYQHEGEECGIVIEGEFEISIDGEVQSLREGDSFSFPSTLKHSYRNPGPTRTTVVWCITPPSY